MTLSEARVRRDLWQGALDAVATGVSYRLGSRMLTRANVDECLRMVRYYEDEVERLSAKRGRGARVMRIVPRDL